MALYLFETHGN